MRAFKHFSFDGHCFKLEPTEEAARKTAEEALDLERAEAGEGWSEDASSICWGEVKGWVEETDLGPADDGEFDRVVEMTLVEEPK